MDIIKAKNMNLWYGNFHALKNVNLSLPEKQITAMIGPSGCGKSTFLKSLNRMNDLVEGCKIEGEITLGGENIYKNFDVNILRKRVGMVFQKPNPFPMSIYDNIAYGPRIHGIKSKARLDEIVEESLKGAAIFDEVTGTLNQMRSYSAILIILLFLMAVLALICIFNITVNERRREFGILLSVGTQKKSIFKMLLLEAGIIGLVGGALGIVLAGGGIQLFGELIIEKMSIPYLISDVSTYAGLALRCVAVSVITSMLSTLYASVKVTRMEPFQLIQEVDR